jgi:hypothetical protein
MEKTVSGVKFEGKWEEIVNRGEEVTEVLEEETESDDVEEWDDWRPREDEDLAKDHREKTVAKASMEPNRVEKEGRTATDKAGEAVGDAGKAVKGASKGDVPEASHKSRRAATRAFLSIETGIRKTVRKVEHVIYTHVISRTNPHYFDSELVSASLKQKGKMPGKDNGDEPEYVMSVTVNDDEVSEKLQEGMEEKEGTE